jgi:peptidoglycan hydrolase-like protein with peptidoglycan-binding domain
MELTAEQERAYFSDAMGDLMGVSYGAASGYSTRATLSKGKTGDDVKELQRLLLLKYGAGSLGSYGPARDGVDGSFGAGTEAKVKLFQGSSGLAPTGVVDAGTWAKLYEATGQNDLTKGEQTAQTIGTIFDSLQKGLTTFGPMFGPKQDYGPPAPGVPAYVPPQPAAATKSFPWGTVALVGVGVLVIGGGLIFVMKRRG